MKDATCASSPLCHTAPTCGACCLGFPGGARGEDPACQCRRHKRCEFDLWVGKIPWRRAWLPTPVFLSAESQGQRSLAGPQSTGSQSQTRLKRLSPPARLAVFCSWKALDSVASSPIPQPCPGPGPIISHLKPQSVLFSHRPRPPRGSLHTLVRASLLAGKSESAVSVLTPLRLGDPGLTGLWRPHSPGHPCSAGSWPRASQGEASLLCLCVSSHGSSFPSSGFCS